MRKLTLRDWIGTGLVLAIAVAYVGFLVNGSMPWIEDARGMAAAGLLIGALAFVVIRTGDELDSAGKAETGLALGSLLLGVLAIAVAESTGAEVVLAIFMLSVLAVWVVEVVDHAGLTHWHDRPGMTSA